MTPISDLECRQQLQALEAFIDENFPMERRENETTMELNIRLLAHSAVLFDNIKKYGFKKK